MEVVEKAVPLFDSVQNHISIPDVKVPMKALRNRYQLHVFNPPNLQACCLACSSELFVVEHHVCRSLEALEMGEEVLRQDPRGAERLGVGAHCCSVPEP